MEQQIDFTRNGYRLFGMLHRPLGDTRGAVLFLHGFGGTRVESGRLFVRTARRLAHQGIASLRFDFAGSGDSEGEDTESTILSQVEDAAVAFQTLRAITRSEPSALGVLGYSLGGAVAALLSARAQFQALVLWAPVSDPIRNFSEHLEIDPDRFADLEGYDVGHRRVGRPFIEELPDVRPLESVKRFQGDLLAIHGTDDEVVLPYNSQSYVDAARENARKVEQIYIEGTGHFFSGLQASEKLVEESLGWFTTRFGRS